MHAKSINTAWGGAGLWLRRIAFLFVFWFVLEEGRVNGWWFAPAIIMGALLLQYILPPPTSTWRWTFAGLARFVPYFLWQSLHGGWDVARIALRPCMPLDPKIIEYAPRLRHPTARLFFTHIISLLPGTLSADSRDDTIVIHALSGDENALRAATAKLERRVAELFGVPLEKEVRQ